jgi:uncharacterized protein (DUF1697 family)
MDYLALLRGINVGGKNVVKMADLRLFFEEMGFADVATHIQSGNVLFGAPRQKREELAAQIEAELSGRLGVEIRVVLLSTSDLRGVVERAPEGFGAESHLNDVVFLRKPLTVSRAIGLVEWKEGVDTVWAGRGVLYVSRLTARASSSRLSRIASLPEYRNMTIRNWSSTRKLLRLIESRSAG